MKSLLSPVSPLSTQRRRPWQTKPGSINHFWRQSPAVLFIFLCLFSLFRIFHSCGWHGQIPSGDPSSNHHRSKNAFVLFLADYSGMDGVPDEQDQYYIGTRVLVHQLLHAPDTRTNISIPVIVLATKDVKPHRRQRLSKDGADVRVVEKINIPEWVANFSAEVRWADAYAKLRTFQLVEFEKVLFLDSDMLLVKPLDGIFDDPATAILNTNSSHAIEDEGQLPPQYMLAAQAVFTRRQHSYPPEPDNSFGFSSGFYVCHPSLEMFDYYLRLLAVPHRIPTRARDQDLMQHAHREDGPMPWKDFDYRWTTTWPTRKEYEMGAHSLHEKWWGKRTGNLHDLDLFLQELWFKAKFEMEVATAVRDMGLSPEYQKTT